MKNICAFICLLVLGVSLASVLKDSSSVVLDENAEYEILLDGEKIEAIRVEPGTLGDNDEDDDDDDDDELTRKKRKASIEVHSPPDDQCMLPDGGTAESRLSSNDIKKFLQEHNKDRKKDIEAMDNMLCDMWTLEWDEELANMSQKSADSCYLGHNNQLRSSGEPVGQNMYMFGGRKKKNMKYVTKKWYEEVENPQGEQKHYYQVVNGKTTRIGCAWTKCQDSCFHSEYKTGTFWLYVCNYDVPFSHGLYSFGEPCSCCTEGEPYNCDDNMCVSCEESDECAYNTVVNENVDDGSLQSFDEMISTCSNMIGDKKCAKMVAKQGCGNRVLALSCEKTCGLC